MDHRHNGQDGGVGIGEEEERFFAALQGLKEEPTKIDTNTANNYQYPVRFINVLYPSFFSPWDTLLYFSFFFCLDWEDKALLSSFSSIKSCLEFDLA